LPLVWQDRRLEAAGRRDRNGRWPQASDAAAKAAFGQRGGKLGPETGPERALFDDGHARAVLQHIKQRVSRERLQQRRHHQLHCQVLFFKSLCHSLDKRQRPAVGDQRQIWYIPASHQCREE